MRVGSGLVGKSVKNEDLSLNLQHIHFKKLYVFL